MADGTAGAYAGNNSRIGAVATDRPSVQRASQELRTLLAEIERMVGDIYGRVLVPPPANEKAGHPGFPDTHTGRLSEMIEAAQRIAGGLSQIGDHV